MHGGLIEKKEMVHSIKVKFDYYVKEKGFFTTTLTLPEELKKYGDGDRRQVVSDYLCKLHQIPTFQVTETYLKENAIEIITAQYETS